MAKGHCKLCASPTAGPALIAGARQGWSFQQALNFAKQFAVTFSEPTWSKHKAHVLAETPQESDAPGVDPTLATDDFLEAVVEKGRRQLADGSGVSIKDAIAAQSLLDKRRSQGSELSLLRLIVTGHVPRILINPPAPAVEGEFKELSPG